MQIPGRSIRINTKIDRVDNWRGNHVTSEAGNFHNFSPVLFSTAELSQQTSGEKEKTRRSSLFFLQREDVRKWRWKVTTQRCFCLRRDRSSVREASLAPESTNFTRFRERKGKRKRFGCCDRWVFLKVDKGSSNVGWRRGADPKDSRQEYSRMLVWILEKPLFHFDGGHRVTPNRKDPPKRFYFSPLQAHVHLK